jgi:hypothetical protein
MTTKIKKEVKKDDVKELLEHIDKVHKDMLELLKQIRDMNNPPTPPIGTPPTIRYPDDTPLPPRQPGRWEITPDGLRWWDK